MIYFEVYTQWITKCIIWYKTIFHVECVNECLLKWQYWRNELWLNVDDYDKKLVRTENIRAVLTKRTDALHLYWKAWNQLFNSTLFDSKILDFYEMHQNRIGVVDGSLPAPAPSLPFLHAASDPLHYAQVCYVGNYCSSLHTDSISHDYLS